jgi:dihydrofolate synthase / folylpolyglutamate synthase
LQKMGYKVGLFTGPHLVDFMERFRINGLPISEDAFCKYIDDVRQISSQFSIPEGQYVGPVGLLAVVAAKWFRDEETDINIYECGRGALHDDVNQVFHQGAVVSPMFLEHRRQLGPEMEHIAKEKAGVITEDTQWVVTNRLTTVPSSAVESKSRDGLVKLKRFGVDFEVYVRSSVIPNTVSVEVNQVRLLMGKEAQYTYENAGVALAAALEVCEQLGRQDIPPVIDLRDLRLPGRMQVIRDVPLLAVDGTIHGESAAYVRSWITELQSSGRVDRVGAIVGLPADKDSTGVLDALRGVADWLIVARAHNPHLTFGNAAGDYGRAHFERFDEVPFIEDAIGLALPRVQAHDALVMLGTQSFVGDVLRYFHVDTTRLWGKTI